MRISDKAAVEKILKAMADPENMKIMVRIREIPKSAQTLTVETGIPLSTVYRKLDELKETGLVTPQHFIMKAGKKIEFLIVTFSELKTTIEDGLVRIDLVPTNETANLKWLGLFRGS
ncbi:MAG: hypothetical protein OK456_08995 [Thaumarchaeota archaeon]|nr:hypothetical protein [Nitrososphaerota archaeon]